jgi:hypothetical protein
MLTSFSMTHLQEEETVRLDLVDAISMAFTYQMVDILPI